MSSEIYIDTHAYHRSEHTQILVGIDTVGVHPWELKEPFNKEDFEKKWKLVSTNCQDKLALGECGLDRSHEGIVGIDIQKEVLMKHFELAAEHSLPIIIHSVRSNSDLLSLLKKKPFKGNILLHAFGGNQYEANELLKYPVYFSYGARLLKNPLTIKSVPIERILLETADQKEVKIEEIYFEAAKILQISLESLQIIILKNFLRFFNQANNGRSSDFIKKINSR